MTLSAASSSTSLIRRPLVEEPEDDRHCPLADLQVIAGRVGPERYREVPLPGFEDFAPRPSEADETACFGRE
jgi:hypothetical protein